jgi:hypothetical protein
MPSIKTYWKNPKKYIALVRERYKEKKEEILAYCHKRYLKNKPKITEINRKWVLNNKEKVRKIKERYRISHREKLRESGRIYARNRRFKDPEKCRKKRRIWRKNNPNKVKNEKLKQKFNLNLEDYNLIIKKQKNRCGICNQKFELNDPNNLKYPCVDHCHKSKKIRGILCRKCNTGIGGFNDNKHLLKRALNWLVYSKTDFKIFVNCASPKEKLTQQQFYEILIKQKNKCGVCGKMFEQKNIKRFHPFNIDHCHKTGKVRGILCPKCNRSLGLLQDSVEIIKKSIKWLAIKE